MNKSRYPIVIASLLLAGCINMQPNYERPAAPIPAQWQPSSGQAKLTGDTLSAELGWEQFFTDNELKKLIRQALENNRDLRVASLNIEKARAQYQIQRAALFPKVNGTVSGTNQRMMLNLPTGPMTFNSHQYSANLGFSSYEMDFFGRISSLRDQAVYQYLSTEEAKRSAQISLVSEVANAYLTLAADSENLALARETLRTQQATFDLSKRQLALGSINELTLRQVETSVESARVNVAKYMTQVDQDRNALALLVGEPPNINLEQVNNLQAVSQTASLPDGLPSTVLQNRPDVLEAERTLQANNANIGAARAAFFPTISLTASAGLASPELGSLFSGNNHVWSFAPQIVLPIFNGGLNKANLKVAEVSREISVAQYEKAIQTAFKEVSDALALRATLEEQLSAQTAQVNATQRSFVLSRARFEKGLDSYLTVLDAQRSYYAAQQNLISVRLSEVSNQVTLYKVLGGGAF
ncbi:MULTISPECIES: efflux transporter outer membrane subunit [unclassified Methylophilus]|uniref:efflux transporter outer membrane subunit n=1 Tax=unclassified Methylophilus TaxID=2630143 RepID=UPI0023B2EC40|nr:efflux transporter outer membrane subunit [Methylophilus sp. YYY-1]MDF0378211.1 efflux transporter outer membrane subunit [Methylophilus sp. YYY-1]BEV07209.1 efflux transporter outer membrane subunit [Methylophilus sp. DW102]